MAYKQQRDAEHRRATALQQAVQARDTALTEVCPDRFLFGVGNGACVHVRRCRQCSCPVVYHSWVLKLLRRWCIHVYANEWTAVSTKKPRLALYKARMHDTGRQFVCVVCLVESSLYEDSLCVSVVFVVVYILWLMSSLYISS
jgi:hypothetical protein